MVGGNQDGQQNATLAFGQSETCVHNSGVRGDCWTPVSTAPTYNPDGIYGALRFAGGGGIKTPAGARLGHTTVVAIVFEHTTTSGVLIDGLDASGRLAVYTATGADIQINNGTGNSLGATNVITVGKYNVVTAVLQGPSSYVDANFPFDDDSGTGDSGTDSGFTGITIGDNYTPSLPFTGLIPEILIWNDPSLANLPTATALASQARTYLIGKYSDGWKNKTVLFPPPVTPATTPKMVVTGGQLGLFFGDSLTFGTPLPKDSWFLPLETSLNGVAHTPFTFLNEGVGGNTFADLLARVNTDVIAQAPNWVWIECSINDLFQQVPLDVFISNAQTLIDQIRAGVPGVQIGMVAPLARGEQFPDPINDRVQQRVDALHWIAAGRNVAFANVRADEQAYEQQNNTPAPGAFVFNLTADGVHCNDTAGAPLMSARAFSQMTVN